MSRQAAQPGAAIDRPSLVRSIILAAGYGLQAAALLPAILSHWFFAAARRWAVAGVLAGRLPVAVVKNGLPTTYTLATARDDIPAALA
jgi:Na+/proline symporter